MADKHTETSALEQALASLRAETGMEFCVYDFSYFNYEHADLRLTLRSRWHCSPFCMKVKESRAAQSACVDCELALGRRATRKGASVVAECHAGLSQLLVPIYRGRSRIGIVSAGQVFIDTPGARKAVSRACERYSLDRTALSSEADKQLCASRSRLRELLPLLSLVRNLIETTVDNADLRRTLSNSAEHEATGRIRMASVPNHFLDRFYNTPEKAHRILGVIRRNYWKPRTQADYARELAVSPRSVNECLRRHTGFTFREIVKMARGSAAAYLVRSEGRSTSEVAYALGYEDVSSFSHAFKDTFGLSPTSYANRQVSVPEEHFVLE